jgi:hypothetical protein
MLILRVVGLTDKHTPEFGIWYSASYSLDLVVFSDADFAGCGID